MHTHRVTTAQSDNRVKREQEDRQLQAKETSLKETKLANTLILDLQPPERGENTFLLFKDPVCGVWLWQPSKLTHHLLPSPDCQPMNSHHKQHIQ